MRPGKCGFLPTVDCSNTSTEVSISYVFKTSFSNDLAKLSLVCKLSYGNRQVAVGVWVPGDPATDSRKNLEEVSAKKHVNSLAFGL